MVNSLECYGPQGPGNRNIGGPGGPGQPGRSDFRPEPRLSKWEREYKRKQEALGDTNENSVGNCGSEEAFYKKVNDRVATVQRHLASYGFREGDYITVRGTVSTPDSTTSLSCSVYVSTTYEEKRYALRNQGFYAKSGDKFVLDDKAANHTAQVKIEGYDRPVIKKELIDNRTEAAKGYDAVKGAKLGKTAGEAEIVNENTCVQKYQNGAVVETVYDDISNPQQTVVTTTYPDGSKSVKLDTKTQMKYDIGSQDDKNYVEGYLNKGSIVEQYAPDGTLVYKQTKGN